ncbi:penicillin-binding protein 2 [Patescibacteria group bacterium]|nr:penicillin-binding protein 2 [Patescibacteria group bacterium]
MEIFGKYNNNTKNYRLKKKSDDGWIESSFGKHAWHNRNTRQTSSFLGITIPKKGFWTLKFLIVSIVIVLLGKAFYLQVAQGAKYTNMAEINRIRQVPIVAERGIIFDRNQKPLVSNIPNFYLTILPNDLPKDENEKISLFQKISNIINVPPAEIEEQLGLFSSYNFQSIPIKTNISYLQAIELEILNNTYPAIQIKTGMGREYDISPSLSHIIGFLRKVSKDDLKNNPDVLPTDDVGKTGVELQYEKILRGSYGKKQIEVNALGQQIMVLAKEDPVPGDDIILTIDSALQKRVEDILEKHLRALGKKRGAIIVSNVLSGEVLAMVSLPAYDNNIFSGGLSYEDYEKLTSDANKPLFNRAIAGEYPSGSTIKPVFAAAALEEGIITEGTSFLSSGGIRVNEWFFPDWKIGGHGATDVKKALAESVNTFFYMIGGGLLDETLQNFIFEGLGVAKLKNYAKKFGLSERLGIDLPSESTGFLPSKEWKESVKKEMWYIGDTYHLAIGQGDILVTPLQVNAWTSIFANGGTLYQPHIVKTILRQDNTVTAVQPKIINENFIDEKNIEVVRKGLRDGVLYGSSRALSDLSFAVAGKTGTAEWGTNKTPHAWFTGFAPYEGPEIAITVLIEEGGEGSEVAVPIAKELLWWYFNG